MSQFAFRLSFALWPLFLGVFLPYIAIFGLGRFVNLFWGVVYGFGLLLTDWIFANSAKSPMLVFGVFIWPLLVSTVLFVVAGKLWKTNNATGRGATLAVLLASSLVVVALAKVDKSPFNIIPTFWKLMFVVW